MTNYSFFYIFISQYSWGLFYQLNIHFDFNSVSKKLSLYTSDLQH